MNTHCAISARVYMGTDDACNLIDKIYSFVQDNKCFDASLVQCGLSQRIMSRIAIQKSIPVRIRMFPISLSYAASMRKTATYDIMLDDPMAFEPFVHIIRCLVYTAQALDNVFMANVGHGRYWYTKSSAMVYYVLIDEISKGQYVFLSRATYDVKKSGVFRTHFFGEDIHLPHCKRVP